MRQVDFNRKRDIMFAKEPNIRITKGIKRKLKGPNLLAFSSAILEHPMLVHYMANPNEAVYFTEVNQFTEAIDTEQQGDKHDR